MNTFYELFDGMDGEAIAYFKCKHQAEVFMQTIMKRYGVDDPEEIELFIFERHFNELPIVD